MLFIIWFSFRLLLLVPNCDTMFFLCSSDHFCSLVSLYFSTTACVLTSYILAGRHSTILSPSTTATRYDPGVFSAFCPLSSNSPLEDGPTRLPERSP